MAKPFIDFGCLRTGLIPFVCRLYLRHCLLERLDNKQLVIRKSEREEGGSERREREGRGEEGGFFEIHPDY